MEVEINLLGFDKLVDVIHNQFDKDPKSGQVVKQMLRYIDIFLPRSIDLPPNASIIIQQTKADLLAWHNEVKN